MGEGRRDQFRVVGIVTGLRHPAQEGVGIELTGFRLRMTGAQSLGESFS